MGQPLRTVTLLDIRLRHVQFSDEQLSVIHAKTVPELGKIAKRLLREEAVKRALAQVAISRQE